VQLIGLLWGAAAFRGAPSSCMAERPPSGASNPCLAAHALCVCDSSQAATVCDIVPWQRAAMVLGKSSRPLWLLASDCTDSA
jgi:hypothetical protein